MSTTVEKRNLSREIIESLRKGGANQEALAKFEHAQLPAPKSEEYKFFPIARLLEKNFPAWPAGVPSTLSSINYTSLLPKGLEADVLVFVNGEWSEKLSQVKTNISIRSQRHAGNAVSQDPLALLNASAIENEVSITVPANTKVETPLVVVYVNEATQQPIVSQSKLTVQLAAGSSLSLIQRSYTLGDQSAFHNAVEEIVVESKAHLDYYKIQDDARVIQVSNTSIRQLENSQVNTFTLTLDGQAIRNNLNIAIDGENCESHFHGLYLLKGDTLADNHTVVDHLKPNSFSNEMYKGVMDDNSKGVFNGKIFVRPHAQKTNAFQSNRNILLSDKATINTKPQLEIWADDVKCSHGCTTGQLNEEAMFYLRARGIPKDTARAMLLYAFVSEVIQHVPNLFLREYMDALVADRLHKDF
jgi:Fe-S cluster assembly protein SufD